MDKQISKYTKLYRKALKETGFSDVEQMTAKYENRLREMYMSPAFKAHNIYPTMDVSLVYAVIAMCLELKEKGINDQEIMHFSNVVFKTKKKAFAALEKIIDILPNSYQIVEKWNISDHEKRVEDKSIAYDQFEVKDGRIEYCISRCMYVRIFEYYGIRSLCKIFCNTDISAYDKLTRHVKFTRYSDLSDGDCCHDVIEKRG
ncbi:MAG: L-2-amino-thiazoline-4-carboxylic acid hydrolase [Erysipelotrichaceae bacterium]|nr:L-2-amino-thiazoline-4-carboxylic acid hydrolase [Erysipelotrichaceae bacterium]